MRTNKNSIYGLGIFTLLFLILYFIFDNEIYKSIISSCFTGTFVGMISSYILYLSDFKMSISEYLIEYSKIIKLIENIRNYKVEYIFKDYDKYNKIFENLYRELDKLIIMNLNLETIDYIEIKQLKLQRDILLDFRKLINNNIYYLYLNKDVDENDKKKILLDLIVKFQNFEIFSLNESVKKIAKMYNCGNLINETDFDNGKDYKSLELMISEIEETQKVLISMAINIEKKK